MKPKQILICLLALFLLNAVAQETGAKNTPEANDNGESVVPEEPIHKVAIYLQYSDKYMDKGIVLTRAGVLHPFLSFSLYDFYVGIYGIYDLNAKNEPQNVKYTFEKTELFVGYAREFEVPLIDSLAVDLRWSYYAYPHRAGKYDANGVFRRWSDGCTQEVSLSLVTGLPLQPGVEMYWDYEQRGIAGALTLEHSLPVSFISDKLSLDNFGELWAGNRHYNLNERNSLRTAQLTTSLNYTYNDNVSFGPFIQMAWHLDSSFRKAVEDSPINNAFNYVIGFSIFTRF